MTTMTFTLITNPITIAHLRRLEITKMILDADYVPFHFTGKHDEFDDGEIVYKKFGGGYLTEQAALERMATAEVSSVVQTEETQ